MARPRVVCADGRKGVGDPGVNRRQRAVFSCAVDLSVVVFVAWQFDWRYGVAAFLYMWSRNIDLAVRFGGH